MILFKIDWLILNYLKWKNILYIKTEWVGDIKTDHLPHSVVLRTCVMVLIGRKSLEVQRLYLRKIWISCWILQSQNLLQTVLKQINAEKKNLSFCIKKTSSHQQKN